MDACRWERWSRLARAKAYLATVCARQTSVMESDDGAAGPHALPYLKPPEELPAEDADALNQHLSNRRLPPLVESDAIRSGGG